MKRLRTPRQQVIDATRKEWMSYGRKHAAIQKRAERVRLPDGRFKTLFRCEHCRELFPRSEIEANHINPVGTLPSLASEDVAAYRERMFCRASEIEALCRPCHRAHTLAARKAARKEKHDRGIVQADPRSTVGCRPIFSPHSATC